MTNLLYKASIVTTPTAYGVGVLNSIKPASGNADFDFTRTSSATRVNPDYLIETVSINSANLVQNGNFSELGAEAITNGNFETNSNWALQNGAPIDGDFNLTILNEKANWNNTVNNVGITQNGILTIGKTYKVEFTVSNYVSGSVRIRFPFIGTRLQANGTYTFYGVATTDGIYLQGETQGGNPQFSIDNVSVKQVDPNDNWIVTDSDANNFVEITQGQARLKFLNASPVTQLATSFVMTAGKKYKLTVDVLTVTSGSIRIAGDGISEVFSVAGTTTRIINPTGNTQIKFYRNTSNVDVTLNSVSLIEIQENGVPRLDYTNGTASILLEPQSTNLFPYSNDFSQSVWNKQSGVIATYNTTETLSPDGTYNATKLVGNGTVGIYSQTTVTGVVARSVYLKSVTGTVNVVLKDPMITVTTKTLSVTTQWQRFELIESNGHASISGLWVDDIPSSGIYIYGAQIESQSFSTSLINTSGSTVTRAAETLNNAGNSDLINSTEGVLYVDIAALADDATNRRISLSDGTTANRMYISYKNYTNQIRAEVISSSSSVFDATYSAIDITVFSKIALKFKLNNFSLYIDGVEVANDTSGAVPTGLKELAFDDGNNSNQFYGRCKTVAVFNEALSDTELACLTSTNNREIFLNYYYRMQYVGANTEALSCAEQTFNI